MPELIEHWFSATQVSTFELCPRKWAWRHIDGVEAPASKFADFGTDTHLHLENWLRESKPPNGGSPEEKVARAMIPYLPPPQTVQPLNVEIELSMKLEGLIFVGKTDLYMPPPPLPVIYDHKTTQDFKWVLEAKEMHDDVQASLYSAWAFLNNPESERVKLQWTYGKTKGAAKCLPVVREVTKKDIEPRLMRSIETARSAQEILNSGVSAIEVSYDAAGCEAFGGCPYQDKCNLSAKDKLRSIMSQGTAADFITKLRARKGAQNGTPVTTPQAVTAPETRGQSLRDKLAAKKAAQVTEETPATPEPIAEKPKRGRPAKAAAAPEPEPDQEAFIKEQDMERLWKETAQGVLMSLMTIPECATGSPNEMAQISADCADALMLEYDKRF